MKIENALSVVYQKIPSRSVIGAQKNFMTTTKATSGVKVSIATGKMSGSGSLSALGKLIVGGLVLNILDNPSIRYASFDVHFINTRPGLFF